MSGKITSDTVPPIPTQCPPSRYDEVNSARIAARIDLQNAENVEAAARRERELANATLITYENLLLEVSGQGTLNLL